MNSMTYIGMDVHKKAINIAMIVPGKKDFIEWQMENGKDCVKRLVKKIKKEAIGEIISCYEAGPLGYTIKREMEKYGVECKVVAPSLIPVKPGERIKTDKRDARKLAKYLKSDSLTEVKPPSSEEEAARDLCRAREQIKGDVTRAKHRISKFLLRQGICFPGPQKAWSVAYRRWLKGLQFEHRFSQVTFLEYLIGLEQVEDRIKSIEGEIENLSKSDPFKTAVSWLKCFRGFDTITAMTVVTELHGMERFDTPRELMSYLGLVPSEMSSSDSIRKGSITKTGNSHVRRVLVEAAWHYRHKPLTSGTLRKRRADQPIHIVSIADKAMKRLYKKYWGIVNRGKNKNKAVVAVARELSGFIWSIFKEMLREKEKTGK